MCPILIGGFSYCCSERIVVTYEAVQVLVLSEYFSGRVFRSEPRRSMDSLSQYVSGRLREGDTDPLRSVHHTTGVQATNFNNADR